MFAFPWTNLLVGILNLSDMFMWKNNHATRKTCPTIGPKKIENNMQKFNSPQTKIICPCKEIVGNECVKIRLRWPDLRTDIAGKWK